MAMTRSKTRNTDTDTTEITDAVDKFKDPFNDEHLLQY